MKSNRIIISILAALGVLLALGANRYAYATETNVTVDVNITALSELTISPNAINWTLVTPGQAGGTKNLDIKNTGSVNVTNIYAYVTTLTNESVRPYGPTGRASNYSAGGVLVFHNASDTNFYWAGREEWNYTSAVSNLDYSSSGIATGSRPAQGFFRNATNAYVWALGNGSTGLCNNSGAIFAIDDDIDNGIANTRKPDNTGITRDGGDANYGYFHVTRAGSVLNSMCVAVDQNCTRMYVYKYDKRPGFTTCTNSNYIVNYNLTPNAIETITADAWVPKGIPLGNLSEAIWDFIGT